MPRSPEGPPSKPEQPPDAGYIRKIVQLQEQIADEMVSQISVDELDSGRKFQLVTIANQKWRNAVLSMLGVSKDEVQTWLRNNRLSGSGGE